jgi:alpha-methylacyl-CoA racemase
MKDKFAGIFLTKTRAEWTDVFRDTDACCTPILEKHEATAHPHNVENGSFLRGPGGQMEPGPSPRLSRTPGVATVRPLPDVGEHTTAVLHDAGYTPDQIQELLRSGAVEQNSNVGQSKL